MGLVGSSLLVLVLLLATVLRAFQPDQLRGENVDQPNLHAWSGLEGSNMVLPDDSLAATNAALYEMTQNLVPSGRVKHVSVFRNPFVLILGGYAVDGTFLDDVQMFDTRTRKWSGVMLKRQCCNNEGEVVETSAIQDWPGNPDPLGTQGERDVSQRIPSRFSPEGTSGKIGFQGDLPLPRAEHAGTEANGIVYIFGGVTQKFSYSQDFYSFDPVALHWRVFDRYTGETPQRRAGHSFSTDYQVSKGTKLYLFGGCSMQGRGYDARLIGLNDVWSFDTSKEVWSCATCIATSPTAQVPTGSQPAPIGRQYHAAAMANGFLIIMGGIDPVSNMTLNDAWAFHAGTKIWKQLFANTGSTGGFAPPPLYHASLLSLTKLTVTANSTGFIPNGFLLYGGVGGGGACGGSACSLLETTLGQVYRLKIVFGTLRSPKTRNGAIAIDGDDIESMYISSAAWEYARLTGQQHDASSKLLKRYAMESVCLDQARGLLYSMGGMQARTVKLSTADQVAVDLDGVSYLDSGEQFPVRLWDRSTGEWLRQTNQEPTNGPWSFQDGFTRFQPYLNNSLQFLKTFRVFSVAPIDVVEQVVYNAEFDPLSL